MASALVALALVQLSTIRSVANKFNNLEQKIKLHSKYSFIFPLQGSRKVILRDCNFPTATTLHQLILHRASPVQILSLHMVQIKYVNDFYWEALLVPWGEMEQEVSIYTLRVIYEPIIVMEAFGFTSVLSLKFITHLE